MKNKQYEICKWLDKFDKNLIKERKKFFEKFMFQFH